MAEVIDEVLENELEASSLDEEKIEDSKSEQPESEPETKEETNPEDDLPEKYKGKSVKDIVAMHQEAEKLIGKQGSEVGDLRKIVDDFIKTQTATSSKTTEKETELTSDDFIDDPQKAINTAVENHPSIKEAREQAKAMKRSDTLSRIKAEFPEVEKTVQDPAFAEWIKSSKVRTELFTRAEVDYDFDSAKELLDTWTERQNISKKVAETSKVDREQQIKAADVGSNSSSSEPVSKKKYRRSDIMKLMRNDPEKYEAMSDEIMAAYRENRVI
jgi:hypothetical protein